MLGIVFDSILFVFECRDVVGFRDALAFPPSQVDRMEERTTSIRIQVTISYQIALVRNFVIRRNGDVADTHDLTGIAFHPNFDAAFGVDLADKTGCVCGEFEFEVVATRVRPPRYKGSVRALEDHAFGQDRPKPMKLLALIVCGLKPRNNLDAGRAGTKQCSKATMPLHYAKLSHVLAGCLQQVKAEEDVANSFTVHDKIVFE